MKKFLAALILSTLITGEACATPYVFPPIKIETPVKVPVENFNRNATIAVIAQDSFGREYSNVESEIISALKSRGFSRTIDPVLIRRALTKKFASTEAFTLRRTLAENFKIDYLILSNVKVLNTQAVSLTSSLIHVNSGRIIHTSENVYDARKFDANADIFSQLARRAGLEISQAFAAVNKVRINLLVSENPLQKNSGALTSIRDRVKNIYGVNEVFVKRMSADLELEVDYNGTTKEFAAELQHAGFKILDAKKNSIKVEPAPVRFF